MAFGMPKTPVGRDGDGDSSKTCSSGRASRVKTKQGLERIDRWRQGSGQPEAYPLVPGLDQVLVLFPERGWNREAWVTQ